MAARAPLSITNGQEQPMLSACSLGDVATLQRLFNIHAIEAGSQPTIAQCVYGTWSRVESKGLPNCMIPSTMELLERAVAARQLAIVDFILQTYPSLVLSQGQNIASTVIEHPDAPILKRVCDHDRAFASLSMDYGMRTFFTEACKRPPDHMAPVLHVLLDYGADIDDGWGAGNGALRAAISRGQPIEIVEKVLMCHSSQHVPISDSHVGAVIGRGDGDIIALLFSSDQIRYQSGQAAQYVKQAEKAGNKAIISIVQEWLNKKGKQHSRVQKTWLTNTCQKVLRSGPWLSGHDDSAAR